MNKVTRQISERLKQTSDENAETFCFRNRFSVAGIGILLLALIPGIQALWDNLADLETFLTPGTWYEPVLIVGSLFLAAYVFKKLLFKGLAKTFGSPCFAVGKELQRYYRFLGINIADRTWRFSDFEEAEVCHRDDGKTYGVGPTPEPGQYFVRLRYKTTTEMLSEWVESAEAEAISSAINARLEHRKGIAA